MNESRRSLFAKLSGMAIACVGLVLWKPSPAAMAGSSVRHRVWRNSVLNENGRATRGCREIAAPLGPLEPGTMLIGEPDETLTASPAFTLTAEDVALVKRLREVVGNGELYSEGISEWAEDGDLKELPQRTLGIRPPEQAKPAEQ